MTKTEAVKAIQALVENTGSVRHPKEQVASVYDYDVPPITLVRGLVAKPKLVARWGDPCKNGYNFLYFHTKAYLYDAGSEILVRVADADDRNDVWRALEGYHDPELEKLKLYHGFSTRLTYYIENTVYHAWDRDCWGLRKGEKRQIVNGRTGHPSWHLGVVGPDGTEYALHEIKRVLGEYADGAAPPELEGYTFKYLPWCRTGEGKERELAHARSTSFWPDATDEELCSDDLADKLVARAPEVLAKAKALIESFGLVW